MRESRVELTRATCQVELLPPLLAKAMSIERQAMEHDGPIEISKEDADETADSQCDPMRSIEEECCVELAMLRGLAQQFDVE
eukprot:11821540-Alexandrium_andersonii.AAC.1